MDKRSETKLKTLGEKHGRLTLISLSEKQGIRGKARYKVKCDCGTIKDVFWANIQSKLTLSCGCLQREQAAITAKRNFYKHGTPIEYYTWYDMIRRCNDDKHHSYPNYGGRGISVCTKWESFSEFLKDMKNKPLNKTLERINNDGNYEPSNCRWATPKEQSNNKRTNRKVIVILEVTLSRAAELLNVNYSKLQTNLNKQHHYKGICFDN